MKEIVITPKTRNTKSLRLRIYKAMLAFILDYKAKEKGGYYPLGFCFANKHVLTYKDLDGKEVKFYSISSHGLKDMFNMFHLYAWSLGHSVYKELLAYKPDGVNNSGAWFVGFEDCDEHRIKILKVIIAKMEMKG